MNIRSIRRGMDSDAHNRAKELVEKIDKSMSGMRIPKEHRTSNVRARAMRKVLARNKQQQAQAKAA